MASTSTSQGLRSSDSQPHEESEAPSLGDSLAQGMTVALVLTLFQRLSGVIRSFLFCGVLDDEQVGLWSLAQTLIFSLAPLAVLGTTSTLRRYVEHYRVRDQLGSFLRITLGFAATLTLVGCLVLILGASFWSQVFFRESDLGHLVIWMAIGMVAIVLFNTLQDVVESLRFMRAASWMRLLHSVGFTIIGAAFVFLVQANVTWVAIAFLIASVVASYPAFPALRAARSQGAMGRLTAQPSEVWRRIGRYATWNCIISFVGNLFELTDRYMLQMLGEVDVHEAHAMVGQYHASRMIPILLIGFAQVVTNVLMPYFAAHWERGEIQEVNQKLDLTLKVTSITMTFGAAVILTLAPILFSVLYGDRYDAGLAVLPMAMTYCIWMSLFVIGEDYLWCCEKGGWATGALVLAVIANFGLNALFIPYFGLQGATVATLMANGIAWVLLLGAGYRFGWKASPAMLVLSLFPLVLSFGVMATLSSCLVLILLLWRGWFFTPSERDSIDEYWQKALAKFGKRT